MANKHPSDIKSKIWHIIPLLFTLAAAGLYSCALSSGVDNDKILAWSRFAFVFSIIGFIACFVAIFKVSGSERLLMVMSLFANLIVLGLSFIPILVLVNHL